MKSDGYRSFIRSGTTFHLFSHKHKLSIYQNKCFSAEEYKVWTFFCDVMSWTIFRTHNTFYFKRRQNPEQPTDTANNIGKNKPTMPLMIDVKK
jgi:hypothetical protein